MTELTRRDANAWRSFFSSEEGMRGLAYIMERRPALDSNNWQQAAGFERFKRVIDEILEFESAGKSGPETDELK